MRSKGTVSARAAVEIRRTLPDVYRTWLQDGVAELDLI
jgi:hypothetical protein